MNKLQSLSPHAIWGIIQNSFRRFPMPIIATICAAVLIEINHHFKDDSSLNLLIACCILSCSLLVAARLIREQTRFIGRPFYWILEFLILVFPVVFHETANRPLLTSDLTRLFQMFVAGHLLVSIAPFIKKRDETVFWEFNKSMFLRLLLSSLYSVILAVGIAVILYALEGLFNLKVNDLYRFNLEFSFLIFHPIHFLSGVPKDLEDLKTEYKYPFGLKVICQYLLIPLISILGIIVLTYGAKIVFTASWPKGIVSSFVTMFSVNGIFTLLLLNPLIKEERSWISKYAKVFYVTEILLALLMAGSIVRRISEYGFTENRYVIALVSMWLIGISLYFLISRKKNIIVIPFTLFILTVMTSFGPWGVNGVALRSQLNRLEHLLKSNNSLVDGELKKSSRPISVKDSEEINSIAYYLYTHHGKNALKRIVKSPAKEYYGFTKNLAIQYKATDDTSSTTAWNIGPFNTQEPIDIRGYKKIVPFAYVQFYGPTDPENNKPSIELNKKHIILHVNKKVISLTHQEFVSETGLKFEQVKKPMFVHLKRPDVNCSFLIKILNIERNKKTKIITITGMNGDLLLR